MTKQEIIDRLIDNGFCIYDKTDNNTSMAGYINSCYAFAFINHCWVSYKLADSQKAEVHIRVSLDVDPMLVFAFLKSKFVELTEKNVLKFKEERND